MEEGEHTVSEYRSEVVAPSNVDGITPEQLNKMGNYIMQGMNESESAVLAGIDRLKLSVARRTSPLYNDFVEKKRLEFKAKHLRILSVRPDAKTSQWLLERLAPDEFSSKGKANEVPVSAVAAIIKEIQEGGEESSSLAFAYKDIYAKGRTAQGTPRDEAEERIRGILS